MKMTRMNTWESALCWTVPLNSYILCRKTLQAGAVVMYFGLVIQMSARSVRVSFNQ